jgi:hypothetical protein
MTMMIAADTDADTDITNMDANADTGTGRTGAQQGNRKNRSE